MVEALPWWLPDGETGDIDDGPPDNTPFMSWRATYSHHMRHRDFVNAARGLRSFIEDHTPYGEGHTLSGASKNLRHATSKRVLTVATVVSRNIRSECLRVQTAQIQQKPIHRKISDGALTIQFLAVSKLHAAATALANSGDNSTEIERARLKAAEGKIADTRRQASQTLGLTEI